MYKSNSLDLGFFFFFSSFFFFFFPAIEGSNVDYGRCLWVFP